MRMNSRMHTHTHARTHMMRRQACEVKRSKRFLNVAQGWVNFRSNLKSVHLFVNALFGWCSWTGDHEQCSDSRILHAGSWIQDLVQDPRYPGPWILYPGFWILDQGYRILDPESWIRDPGSSILHPGFWILHPGPGVLDP